jgi:hypothetical protein
MVERDLGLGFTRYASSATFTIHPTATAGGSARRRVRPTRWSRLAIEARRAACVLEISEDVSAMLARVSTVTGESGSPATWRDAEGMGEG